MLTAAEVRRRVLQGGDTPVRRALLDAHFASGAPRKLRAAARHVDLERARVLELGCGWGIHLVHFAAGSLGLDADAERVAFARTLGCAAEVRDLDAPGWSAGCRDFDVVFVADLLMHLRRPEVLAGELRACLRPGGSLVLSEWVFPAGRLARALALRVPGARTVFEHEEHLRHYTADDLVRFVEDAGLPVRELFVHSFDSPTLVKLIGRIWPPHTLVADRRD